jgi:hypothetical protein
MADAKHTPGPWSFRTAYNGDCGISAEGTGVFIEAFAEIRHSGENAQEEAKANARLIAASPDLLDALRLVWDKVLTEYHSPESYVRQIVEAAIAKAEGRS